MAAVNRGEVWTVDFGAKEERCALLLTGSPTDDDLDLITALLHTTTLHDNHWELNIPKPFLKSGAFHIQEIHSISSDKLKRRLGELSEDEMNLVGNTLAERLFL